MDDGQRTTDKLEMLAASMETAMGIAERQQPLPFDRPDGDAQHIANAIVMAGQVQAAATLVAAAAGMVK